MNWAICEWAWGGWGWEKRSQTLGWDQSNKQKYSWNRMESIINSSKPRLKNFVLRRFLGKTKIWEGVVNWRTSCTRNQPPDRWLIDGSITSNVVHLIAWNFSQIPGVWWREDRWTCLMQWAFSAGLSKYQSTLKYPYSVCLIVKYAGTW